MSINKINGVKKQDSFGPGVDNNNFIRVQDLNDVIDAVNVVFDDVNIVEILAGLNLTTSYADVAAAATGGVAIGSFYRTGSIIKIRVA